MVHLQRTRKRQAPGKVTCLAQTQAGECLPPRGAGRRTKVQRLLAELAELAELAVGRSVSVSGDQLYVGDGNGFQPRGGNRVCGCAYKEAFSFSPERLATSVVWRSRPVMSL